MAVTVDCRTGCIVACISKSLTVAQILDGKQFAVCIRISFVSGVEIGFAIVDAQQVSLFQITLFGDCSKVEVAVFIIRYAVLHQFPVGASRHFPGKRVALVAFYRQSGRIEHCRVESGSSLATLS